MGASSSKVASKAAGAVGKRQYPSTSSILNSATSTSNAPSTNAVPPSSRSAAPSQVHPDPTTSPATDTKDSHVDLDGRDPHFGAALRRLGPAVPSEQAAHTNSAFPTSSQPPVGQHGRNIFPDMTSAANNPSLMIVQTRDRINNLFDQEVESIGRSNFAGRTLMSAKDIKEALRLRDEAGKSIQEVEKQLRLKPGILSQLAAPGVVANV